MEDIYGVQVFSNLLIPDERGMVTKIANPPFQVRDVYTTTVRYDAIKAWHGYQTKKIYWTVVSGLVRLVLYDARETSPTYNNHIEYFIGPVHPISVLVPPGVFSGFKGISMDDAIIVVQADEVYGQITRLKPDYFESVDWSRRNG